MDSTKSRMVRTITYWNKLFPDAKPYDLIRYNGKMLTRDEIISVIDQARLEEFAREEFK